MSDSTVHHFDGIDIYYDESHGLPSSINLGFASFMPQARGSGSNGWTTQNKYFNFFSCMNEKSGNYIGFNGVVVPKTKWGSYGSKDYLCN